MKNAMYDLVRNILSRDASKSVQRSSHVYRDKVAGKSHLRGFLRLQKTVIRLSESLFVANIRDDD